MNSMLIYVAKNAKIVSISECLMLDVIVLSLMHCSLSMAEACKEHERLLPEKLVARLAVWIRGCQGQVLSALGSFISCWWF